MIRIKNPKIFTCSKDKPYHWSKLPKMVKVMATKRLDFSYANLSYADLCYANFSYADLSSADLSYADLSSADLSYADLCYANFSYADLSSADLRSIDLNNSTRGLKVVAVGNQGTSNRTYFYYPQIDKVNASYFWDSLTTFESEVKANHTGEILKKSLKAIEIFKIYRDMEVIQERPVTQFIIGYQEDGHKPYLKRIRYGEECHFDNCLVQVKDQEFRCSLRKEGFIISDKSPITIVWIKEDALLPDSFFINEHRKYFNMQNLKLLIEALNQAQDKTSFKIVED